MTRSVQDSSSLITYLSRGAALGAMALLLSFGCKGKVPEGTNPPGDDGGTAVNTDGGGGSGEDGGNADGGGDGDGGEAPPVAKECPAEVSDTPFELFASSIPGRVLVRLPKNTTVYEENPFLYLVPNANQQSTCDVIVSRMAFGYYATDAKLDPVKSRDDVMSKLGLPPEEISGWEEEKPAGRNYTGIYKVPEGKNGEPPIQGVFVLKEAADFTVWAVYEAHPNAFPAVKATYLQSAAKLLLLPKK